MDVVFVTSVGPDTTPPVVNGVTPASGSSSASPNTTVTATFNENVTNVTGSTFELTAGQPDSRDGDLLSGHSNRHADAERAAGHLDDLHARG